MPRPDDGSPSPRRKRIRLPLQDYSTPTARYFVTICCRGKKPLLARPTHRSLVRDLLCLTARSHRVELPAYTILPTHLHFIASGVGSDCWLSSVNSKAGLPSNLPGMASYFPNGSGPFSTISSEARNRSAGNAPTSGTTLCGPAWSRTPKTIRGAARYSPHEYPLHTDVGAGLAPALRFSMLGT